MPIKQRPHPKIPDHEVLRKIGHGAYGEVWMAQGVTGAMRAVKVVYREDFSDERTFEREFEGILKFEPISRDHPGLVNILHVGRSPDSNSFYYYVMELGDDVHTGQEINPVEYEARTLRPDDKSGVRLDTSLCIDVGIRLSEALHHLHEGGLAHRDVKPSNIIFVNGKAKLADIGLVAARDQRTFVGTEGFVPPEGPGSAQADIYSLGKVLYELATGKDRLDFPELPDELPTGPDKKRWLALNEIICEVCEPRSSKRKITTALELATTLRALQRGTHRRKRGYSIWATTVILLTFAAWASWEGLKDSTSLPWNANITAPAATPAQGLLRIATSPEGAEVFDQEGNSIGITPTATISAEVGSKASYLITKKGHRSIQISETVTEDSINEPMLIFRQLQNFSPPIIGEKWNDHLGTTYLPDGEAHISSKYVSRRLWKSFLNQTKRNPKSAEFIIISENGKKSEIVLAQKPDIYAFSDWIRAGGIRNGFFTEDNEVFGQIDASFKSPNLSKRAKREKLKPFRTVIRNYQYGTVQLTSEPPGADIFIDGRYVGNTSEKLSIPKVKPGNIELFIVLEGFKPLTMRQKIAPDQNLTLTAVLQQNQGVVFGKSWQNGIAMKFEPLGKNIMASVFETRIKDYNTFLAQTKHRKPRPPGFPQGPEHPIVSVSRKDAKAFCEWLTERERKEERISNSHTYRLPTDEEWSKMAGLDFELGDAPGTRDANKPDLYLWGKEWPPPENFGNYADESAASLAGTSPDRIITGYDDTYPRTSPAGSFQPNKYGLYDLSGNIQEWVSDDISTTSSRPLGLVRGGGWNTYLTENLLLGWRNPVPTTVRSTYYGFRIVLAREDPS